MPQEITLDLQSPCTKMIFDFVNENHDYAIRQYLRLSEVEKVAVVLTMPTKELPFFIGLLKLAE